AVRGPGVLGVEAQPRLDAGDRAVGVHRPLLVGLAVAVPDVHPCAGLGAVALGVQAFAAVDPQFAGVGGRPLLVGSSVALPQLHRRAVVLRDAGHVQALAGGDVRHLAARSGFGRLEVAEGGEEVPHLVLDPAVGAALTTGASVDRSLLVPAVEGGPDHGIPLLATGVGGGDVGARAGGGLGRALRGAAVVAHEPVAHRPCLG